MENNMQTLPSLRCQAHWQNTQSQRHNQILPKSLPALSTLPHGQKDNAAKIKDGISEDKNGQLVTKAICNKGFSGNSSILHRIKFRVGGQDSSPQSLTAYSLSRYRQV
jgi:hypothetical protein